VQHQVRRDEEGSGGSGGVPSIGATARVWRIRRHPDGGGGGGSRWNRVGRGRSSGGGNVHRWNCADGRVEAGIWRWGGEAWEENFLVNFVHA
jgi:hypothetical protein